MDVIAILTAILGVIAACQAILTWLGVQTTRRQLRAYALVSECHPQPPSGWRTYEAAEMSITNFGQTPAREFKIDWTATACPGVLGETPPPWNGSTQPAVLAPSDKEMFDVELKSYDKIPADVLHSGRDLYDIRGTATYTDVFGQQQTTNFHAYVHWTGARMKVSRRPYGNDAS